ncbi:MAG: dihydrolipoyllysine-residue acetyltransferase [Gammaproteobacteria bacterium]|nr:dihydrolipoyllysine-residue acetyltransferase [Gammaproteobacteria bacterium]
MTGEQQVTTDTKVLVPDIGDFSGVEVIEVMVSPGDRVAVEDSLITLESDKATMEIPSPYEGVVKEIIIKVGDTVTEGDLLLIMEQESAGESPPPSAPPQEAPAGQAPVPASQPPATDGSPVQVSVPDIGDFSGVEVIEVTVSPGDRVNVEDSLITLESDKATMEIPSPYAGEVKEVVIKVGDTVKEGDALLMMVQDDVVEASSGRADGLNIPSPASEEVGTVQAPAPVESRLDRRLPGEKESSPPPLAQRPSDVKASKAHASPSVRRFARELGADLLQIKGSGPKGRITREDVQGFIKKALSSGGAATPTAGPLQLPAIREVDFSAFGEVEEKPLERMKKLSGAHLSASWLNIPHVTQFDEADITDLEAFRKEQKSEAAKQDIRLTMLPLLMKACVGALSTMPAFNSSLSTDKERLIFKHYFHIGIAVDTPKGLIVPVIRDVDKKGILELAAELMETSVRARAGKLLPADLQGGCFSISSLGGIGGNAFTPIINAPEVAILGVSRSSIKPVWDGQAFQPRLMLPLSLSYDHRVIDGAQAARFTSLLAGLLSDMRRLLL